MIYSLHYTQGSASADGEVKTPAYNSHAVSTYNIPYSQLSETIEMLSKDSKEHSAIPETLYESGLYKDPRLFPYFVKAISDSHSVISDYNSIFRR
jgi:hypothetical protein